MKCLVLVSVFAVLHFTQGSQLPGYLKPLACRRSDPKYAECLFDGFQKAMPYFVKGIKELNFPPIDPFELPLMTVNRTLNELISIRATLKDIKMTGAKDTVIEYVNANPNKMFAEVRMNIPYTFLTMEYDVNGQLLAIPLRSKGFFAGNFTDVQIYMRGTARLVEKDDQKFLRIDKLNSKLVVGDGYIKLIAKDPGLQFAADLIANFYNENPRRAMDAVNPIFVESSNDLFRVVGNQILGSIPASEFLPE